MGRATTRNSFANEPSFDHHSHIVHFVARKGLSEKSMANWIGQTRECHLHILQLPPDLHEEILFGEDGLTRINDMFINFKLLHSIPLITRPLGPAKTHVLTVPPPIRSNLL